MNEMIWNAGILDKKEKEEREEEAHEDFLSLQRPDRTINFSKHTHKLHHDAK
jgi:membrane-anchored protein YejM (alkaline phosphatase superfamily)